jgi:2,3-dihydroxybenzoate-AMP ligase
MTDILTRHAQSDAVAVIEGERSFSYRQLHQASDNLASALQAQGIQRGETALVQLAMWLSFTSPSLRCLKSALPR